MTNHAIRTSHHGWPNGGSSDARSAAARLNHVSSPKQLSLFEKNQKSLFDCHSDLGDAALVAPKPPARLDQTEQEDHQRKPSFPLAVPDRQEPIDFETLADLELPPQRDERNALSVDRRRADIDGPPHRFTIRLGDYVEVFFPPDAIGMGEVVDLSPREQEVRVAFHEGEAGEWFPVAVIFPCPSFDYFRAEELAWRKLPKVSAAEASTPQAYQLQVHQTECRLAALARLKRLEESLTQGVAVESFVHEEDVIEPPELPTGRIFAIDDREVYDWFVSRTPGHYIDECGDCPDGPPVVIGWEDDHGRFVRQLTRTEAQDLRRACNAAHGHWDRQLDEWDWP
jgi:hypothetical protein